MTEIALSLFLLVFGVSMVIETKVPGWMVGVLAIVAGIAVLFRGFRK